MTRLPVLMLAALFVVAPLGLDGVQAQTPDAPQQLEKKKKPTKEEIFKELDTDSNGSLSLAEFSAKAKDDKAKEKMAKLFKKLDKDSSESLSLEEFVGPVKKPAKPKKPKKDK